MSAPETPLDVAFAAMTASPDDCGARLRFHERLLDAALFVPLETEATDGAALRPLVLDLDADRFVPAFDRDDRLAASLDAPAPYACLPGRRLAEALAGQDIGIALYPGVAPSATLIAPATVDWLAGMAAATVAPMAARPRGIVPPTGASPALIGALEAKLGAMAGTIGGAWLARLTFEDGASRLALAIVGVSAAAEPGVAAAIGEAVRFSGAAEDALDVTFLSAGTPALAAFERWGLGFELARAANRPAAPRPPATEPDRPPRLR